MSEEAITTRRTRLRRISKSDLSNMSLIESDAEIMKFTSMRVPQTLEETARRIDSIIEKQAETAPLGVWIAELKETNEFVGWFMLLRTRFETPELGFMLPRHQWGKGLATEVAAGLLNFAFHEQKQSSVVALTNLENLPSIRVLEKSGLKFVKVISLPDKITGQEVPLNFYQMENPHL